MKAAMQPTRAILAVPGHRSKMIQSAATSNADGVFIDLEDAVPPDSKQEALRSAIAAINELDWGTKVLTVRVNAPDGKVVEAEIEALSRNTGRLDTILVPKVETPETLQRVETLVDRHAGASGGPKLEALIETARGILEVDRIAAAQGRLIGLHFGVGDFSASIGARSVDVGGSHAGYAVTRKDEIGNYLSGPLDLWAYPMMKILVAARAFGLRAIDGPFGGFRDIALTEATALKAAAMGYDGKQVIHPSQIDATVAAFMPTSDEIAFATKTLTAMAEADASGLAAVSIDGKMVDYANVRMAQRVLAMAGLAAPM